MIEISVIVTTMNRSKDIGETIDALLAQSFPNEKYEIIVVDGSLDDLTRTVINNYKKTHLQNNIEYINEPTPGVTPARHRGLQAAKGKILTFIEDDARAGKDHLSFVYEMFQDENVGMVGGRCIPNFEVEPPKWIENFYYRDDEGIVLNGYLSLIDCGEKTKEINPNLIWALNLSIRKEILLQCGGFHPDLMPGRFAEFQGDGETGLTTEYEKLGMKSIYHPEIKVYHKITKDRFTLSYFKKREYFQGIANSYTECRKHQKPVNLDSRKFRKRILDQLKVLKINMMQRMKLDITQYYPFLTLLAKVTGSRFHYAKLKENPLLLNWVLKKDYYDYDFEKYR